MEITERIFLQDGLVYLIREVKTAEGKVRYSGSAVGNDGAVKWLKIHSGEHDYVPLDTIVPLFRVKESLV